MPPEAKATTHSRMIGDSLRSVPTASPPMLFFIPDMVIAVSAARMKASAATRA